MSDLWRIKANYRQFENKRHHINETCGRYDSFIPYERKYAVLNQEQLLELIHDAKTNHWQALDLSNCGLSQLPDELWELSDLKMLYLGNRSSSRIRHDEVPSSSDNRFAVLPRKIERLPNLQVLSLSQNPVQIEGETPLNLPHLIHLDIFDCGYRQIPNSLLISSLQEIGFNCLEEKLSDSFARLKRLKRIYLTNSAINELPAFIDSFANLQQLHVYGTQITSLPYSISQLRYLSKLAIFDTPLAETLPPEILQQSGKDIIRYVFSQQSDAPKHYFNECKMVIVGQGHVGKSSLLNRLIRNTYSEGDSTEGIDISSWSFRKNGQQYKLNVWDFGGQEIYHSTHQFLLQLRRPKPTGKESVW